MRSSWNLREALSARAGPEHRPGPPPHKPAILAIGERLAHLILVPNPPHRAQGDFSLRSGSVGNAGEPRYTYSGVAVMSPQLVKPVKRGDKAPLAPLLRSGADERRISGEVFDGLWQDVGTAERLAELESQLASKK